MPVDPQETLSEPVPRFCRRSAETKPAPLGMRSRNPRAQRRLRPSTLTSCCTFLIGVSVPTSFGEASAKCFRILRGERTRFRAGVTDCTLQRSLLKSALFSSTRMSPTLVIGYTALKVAVAVMFILNELALVANPWILIPSHCRDSANSAEFNSTALTATIYPVSEALWSCFWIGLGWGESWIAVMHFPVLSLCASEYVAAFLRGQATTQSQHSEDPHMTEDKGKSEHSKQQVRTRRSDVPELVLFLPIQAAAATNSALVLLLVEICFDPESYQSSARLGLAWFSVSVYLGCRFADFRICRLLRKYPPEGETWLSRVKAALPYAIILLVIRTSIRLLLDNPNPLAVLLKLQTRPEPHPWAVNGIAWLGQSWLFTWSDFLPTPVTRWALPMVSALLCVGSAYLAGAQTGQGQSG